MIDLMHPFVLFVAGAANLIASVFVLLSGFKILQAWRILGGKKYFLASLGLFFLALATIVESLGTFALYVFAYPFIWGLPRALINSSSVAAAEMVIYPLGYILFLSSYIQGEKASDTFAQSRLSVIFPGLVWLAPQAVSVVALVAMLVYMVRNRASVAVIAGFALLALSHVLLFTPTPRFFAYAAMVRALGFLLLFFEFGVVLTARKKK